MVSQSKWLVWGGLVVLLVTWLGCADEWGSESEESPAPIELRGVWITNIDSDVLDSRESIAEAMAFLNEHNFNAVFPVVWNEAMTLYPSDVVEEVTGTRIDPHYGDRDPLQEVIEEAQRYDIAVIPWFEYGFAASHEADGGPILETHPEWAARDRSGELLEKNGFEWMNAYHPEVQDFIIDLVLEVVENYEVDGVQGDDRLPAQPVEGGYSSYTDSLYRAEHDGASPPSDYRDPDWMQWRADWLTAFAERLYDDVKAVDDALQVSWSPGIYSWSKEEYLQDWPAWMQAGVADLMHPQVYRRDVEEYAAALADQHPSAVGAPEAEQERMTPGVLMQVGDYRIDPDHLVDAVALNRDEGYPGEVFFFYEGLRANDDELAEVLLQTHYERPAELPFERATE